MNENQREFMEWMQENFPVTYQEAVIEATDKMARSGLSGLSAEQMGPFRPGNAPAASGGSWWNSFTSSIGDLGGKYIQYKSQRKIMRMQLKRAEQGLPPMDTSALAPVIKIQPELSPAVVNDIKKYLIPAVAGILALGVGILLTRKK